MVLVPTMWALHHMHPLPWDHSKGLLSALQGQKLGCFSRCVTRGCDWASTKTLRLWAVPRVHAPCQHWQGCQKSFSSSSLSRCVAILARGGHRVDSPLQCVATKLLQLLVECRSAAAHAALQQRMHVCAHPMHGTRRCLPQACLGAVACGDQYACM